MWWWPAVGLLTGNYVGNNVDFDTEALGVGIAGSLIVTPIIMTILYLFEKRKYCGRP